MATEMRISSIARRCAPLGLNGKAFKKQPDCNFESTTMLASHRLAPSGTKHKVPLFPFQSPKPTDQPKDDPADREEGRLHYQGVRKSRSVEDEQPARHSGRKLQQEPRFMGKEALGKEKKEGRVQRDARCPG